MFVEKTTPFVIAHLTLFASSPSFVASGSVLSQYSRLDIAKSDIAFSKISKLQKRWPPP